jgi:alpha-L-fucosidase
MCRPPHAVVADPDARELERLGALIAGFRGRTEPAALTASSTDGAAPAPSSGFGPDLATVWRPDGADPAPRITVDLASPRAVEAVVLSEDIRLGQRVERVVVSALVDDELVDVAEARSVGYRRILRFTRPVTTARLVVTLDQSRGTPSLASLATIGAEAREPVAAEV